MSKRHNLSPLELGLETIAATRNFTHLGERKYNAYPYPNEKSTHPYVP